MTNEERGRTCSYHWETFPTFGHFLAHWNSCEIRVRAGYIDEDLGGHS